MKNHANEPNENGQRNSYELSSDAVERLATADTGETPRYSEEELKKYRKRNFFHIPEPVKILFLKAWFAGAVCYFILWGLGIYIGNYIDMLFVLGIVLGMVTDLLTNNVIRFIETTPGSNSDWILVNKKGVIGFVGNLFFSMVIVVCVYFVYDFINRFVVNITGDSENLFLGVEPVLYGLFCMGFDMLFIGMKRLCLSIFRDAKAAALGTNRGQEDGE